MKKNLKGRVVAIIVVLLVCLYGIFGIPHGVSGKALTEALTNRIHLGLDLKGGAHLILRVQVQDAINAETDNTVAIQAALTATVAKGYLYYRTLPAAASSNVKGLTGLGQIGSGTWAFNIQDWTIQ